MSKHIATIFKEEIKRSHWTYERFAEAAGLNSKQNLSFWLNHKDDDAWLYDDIKKFCRLLGINHTLLLQDVDRKRGNS